MTSPNYLHRIAIGFALMIGLTARVYGEGDVTIVSPPASTASTTTQKDVAPDGTAIVHKSLHKKKSTATAKTTPAPGANTSPPPSSTASVVAPAPAKPSASAPVATKTAPAPAPTVVSTTHPSVTTVSAPAKTTFPNNPTALGPAIETGLPVARHAGAEGSSPIPTSSIMQTGVANPTTAYQKLVNPLPSIPNTSLSGANSYSPQAKATTSAGNFVFTNYTKKAKTTYPWKTNIITTMFWIGEGGSSISPTTNIGSAWDENWRTSNRGTDNPTDRSGFAPADHAPTVNPFYVALPFNDLAYPDKARRWLPSSWHRPNKDGKQVSACKDRWVKIKNAQGRICYAQWEDVGPLTSDHAEYVFGSERPDTLTRAGLDVSPAVAQFLALDGNNRYTSWCFVDEEDVPPGAWLKYDELALLYAAMHQVKSPAPARTLPIQRASEPIDDASNVESNKKKVGAAKG